MTIFVDCTLLHLLLAILINPWLVSMDPDGWFWYLRKFLTDLFTSVFQTHSSKHSLVVFSFILSSVHKYCSYISLSRVRIVVHHHRATLGLVTHGGCSPPPLSRLAFFQSQSLFPEKLKPNNKGKEILQLCFDHLAETRIRTYVTAFNVKHYRLRERKKLLIQNRGTSFGHTFKRPPFQKKKE